MPRVARRSLPALALLVAVTLSLCGPSVAAQSPPLWRDTGLRSLPGCFDATQPGIFYTSEYAGNTTGSPRVSYVNNYRTGQHTRIAARGFDSCDGATGSLFALNDDGVTAVRFSVANPSGIIVDHFPNHIAPLPAGGAIYYSLGGTYAYDTGSSYPPSITPTMPGRLFVSADGGLTWEERGAQFGGAIAGVALTGADTHSLYALTLTPQPNGDRAWVVTFSADAGATWEARAAGTDGYDTFYRSTTSRALLAVPGRTAPVATVGMVVTRPGAGPHVPRSVQLSADGGRTFTPVGTNLYGTTGPDSSVTLHATSAGILRSVGTYGTYMLSLSTDGGATFIPGTSFASVSPGSVQAMTGIPAGGEITVAPAAPHLVLLHGTSGSPLALSRDGGQTWEPAGVARRGLVITPTTPPVVLGYDGERVVALDLPVAP